MKKILKLAAFATLLSSLAFADGANTRESVFGKKKPEAEQPATETPKSEPVKTESSRPETPKTEPVKTESSKPETPKTEQVQTAASKPETPKTEQVPAKTEPTAKPVQAPVTSAPESSTPRKSGASAPAAAATPAPTSEPAARQDKASVFSKISSPPATETTDTAANPAAAAANPEFSFNNTDPYTGWAYTAVDTAVYRKGHLKAVMSGTQGTFGLYAVRDDGKEIPLLSSYDFFNSTAFMLRVGRKEYLLNYSGGIASEARQTEAGIQMSYTIPGKATFLLDFTFPEEGITGGLEDTIKVTMYTVNLGQNPQTFTSKAIFDTILGESSSKHFLTFAIPELNTQRKFHSMKADRWVCSASNAAAIEFVFYGADITEPDCVTLGPIGKLSDYWEPDAHEGKGFSTALSYNNSGVAANWKTAYLLPEQIDVKTFYIATAEGVEPIYAGRMPAGDELVESIEAGEGPFPGDKGNKPAKANEAVPAGTAVSEEVSVPAATESAPATSSARQDVFGKSEPVQEQQPAPAVKEEQALPVSQTEPEKPPLSEAAKAVSEQQLDYEYIQNLIDYIESLQDAESIDREELTSLNEELDAIFERLRSMGN